MDTTFSPSRSTTSAAWGGVLAMSLCVSLLIASEFMPVSLLTPMAEGLGATTGQTGQAISISGLFAVLASLLVTTVAGTLNRKGVLLTVTGLMLASLVLVAMAPNFTVLIIGRALLGICIGGFWSLATAVIMRLVPKGEVARALAFMYGGQAIASAFAAPLGSYLGGIFGWREVFWALVPIVALNLLWLAVSLPSLPANQRQDFRSLFAVLRRSYFARGLLAATLSWGSAFTMFTYLRPFLEQVTQADLTSLSVLLLVLGCAGFAGNWGAGRLIGPQVAPLLKLPALVMGGCTLGLLIVGGSVIGAAVLLAIWGAMNTAMSVIWMTWMSRNVDDAPEAGGSLMVAGIQASIMLGAVLGGLLLDAMSIHATFVGSVVLALAALALIGSGRGLLKL
jgi:predicted MFS family arabinose efflux permease